MPEKQAIKAASNRKEKREQMPRRNFIRNAILGAAGAPVLLGVSDNLAARDRESGSITLDALMLTYFSAPLGALGSSSWTLTGSYDTTFRLRALAPSDLSLEACVPAGEERFGEPAFKQNESTQVSGGLTLRRGFVHGEVENTLTPTPGVPGNAMLYGLLRPQLQLDGSAESLRFRFLRADAIFLLGVAGIQNDDLVLRGGFSRSTVNSFVSQYVTDPAALSEPRFELRVILPLRAGVKDVFTFAEFGGGVFSEPRTVATTATIVEQTGFNSDIVKQAFKVGGRVEVIYDPVREFDSNEIIKVETSLKRPTPGVNKVYWDRVFKTFIIIDAGPAARFGQPVVQGEVTDGIGHAIPGVLVKLRQHGVDYATLTDCFGRYEIATPPGEPLATGAWPIMCGNVVKNVSISGGMMCVDFDSVAPESARQRSFDWAVQAK